MGATGERRTASAQPQLTSEEKTPYQNSRLLRSRLQIDLCHSRYTFRMGQIKANVHVVKTVRDVRARSSSPARRNDKTRRRSYRQMFACIDRNPRRPRWGGASHPMNMKPGASSKCLGTNNGTEPYDPVRNAVRPQHLQQ